MAKKILFYNLLFLLLLALSPLQTFANFKQKALNYVTVNYPHVGDKQAYTLVHCVDTYAKRYDIPRRVLLAVILSESSGVPSAQSAKGAIGLTQINYTVWGEHLKRAGVVRQRKDLFSIRPAVEAGAFILRQYYTEHKHLRPTLRAYAGSSSDIVYAKVKTLVADMQASGVTF